MSTTVNPLDSDACGLCACGQARCGVEYITFIGTAKTESFPELRVHAADMSWVASIKNYTSLKITREFYGAGSWECEVGSYEEGVDLFVEYGFVSIADDNVPFVGLVENINPVMTKEGKSSEVWKVSGRGVKALLMKRATMHNFTNAPTNGYDVQTGVKTETAVRHFVDMNFITTTDAKRAMTGITLATTDQLRGTDVDTQTRGDNPLDIIENLCTEGGVGYDIEWAPPAMPASQYAFVFDIKSGRDLSTVGTSGCVSLTVDFKNIEGFDYKASVANCPNVAYVAGTGTGESRILETVWLTVSEPQGNTRWETFVDAPDCATSDALIQRGYEVLTELAGTYSMEIDFNPESTTYVYGRDFRLGDIINVVIPYGTQSARIISVEENYDDEGTTIKLVIGKKKPDLKRTLNRLYKKITPRLNT